MRKQSETFALFGRTRAVRLMLLVELVATSALAFADELEGHRLFFTSAERQNMGELFDWQNLDVEAKPVNESDEDAAVETALPTGPRQSVDTEEEIRQVAQTPSASIKKSLRFQGVVVVDDTPHALFDGLPLAAQAPDWRMSSWSQERREIELTHADGERQTLRVGQFLDAAGSALDE